MSISDFKFQISNFRVVADVRRTLVCHAFVKRYFETTEVPEFHPRQTKVRRTLAANLKFEIFNLKFLIRS